MKTMTTNQNRVSNEPTTDCPQNYAPPSPEQIEDIRKRLAEVSPDTLERAHHAFKHDTIDAGGSVLWKAGVFFSSDELYEYRKTLFPPNSMVDAYSYGPPVLVGRGTPAEPSEFLAPTSSSANPEDSSRRHEDAEPSAEPAELPPSGLRSPTSALCLLSDLRDL